MRPNSMKSWQRYFSFLPFPLDAAFSASGFVSFCVESLGGEALFIEFMFTVAYNTCNVAEQQHYDEFYEEVFTELNEKVAF